MHTEGDEPFREERPNGVIDDCESFWLKSVLSRIEEENAAPSTIHKFSEDYGYPQLRSTSSQFEMQSLR